MGSSVSSSLEGTGCCHGDRDDEFLNYPAAPLRADEVVRPDGERHAVRPASSAIKAAAAVRCPRSNSADEMAKWKSEAKSEASSKARRSYSSLPEQVEEEGVSEEQNVNIRSEQTEESSPGGGSQAGRNRRASLRSVGSESPWKKPREVAKTAMKYMGFLGSSEKEVPVNSTPEQFAVDLVELALAVCTANSADCLALARAAARDDRKALTRLSEFARRHNLLKDGNHLFNGSMTMKELAQAFMDSGGTVQQKKFGQNARSRSNLSISSLFEVDRTGTEQTKDSGSHGSQASRGEKKSGEALTLSDLAARQGGEAKSKLTKMGSNLSHMSRNSFMRSGRSGSSLMVPTYSRTHSDLSCTSFSDFNRKRSKMGPEAMPSLMEYFTVANQVDGGGGGMFPFPEENGGHTTGMVMDVRLPKIIDSDNSGAGFNNKFPAYTSEGADTYHSATDAVLQGEGEEKEVVQAEVLNMTEEGRVRIAFRSRCLRTQNAWQRHLLQQQRSLLQIHKQRKEAVELQLRQDEEVKEEQKELLRGFRKIIQRELGSSDEVHRATIFVVEKDDELRNEMQGLCRIMKYPCEGFRHLGSAEKSLQAASLPRILSRRFSHNEEGGSNLLLDGRAGSDTEDWRVISHRSSTASCGSPSTGVGGETLRIVLLGVQWLERKIPDSWKEDESIAVVLTSQAEEFEDVGRMLLASGEAEIRERLRERGIYEYLLHPLSLESLQGVISKAIRQRFADEYLLIGALGRGNSGIVHEAKRLRDSATFALKEIPTGRLGRAAKHDVEQEAQLLQELKWPTVLFVVDAWENKQAQLRLLLMPLLKGGSLLQYVDTCRKNGEKVNRDSVASWYVQTLHGLTYLHWRGVLHRDLKPGNLFLSENQEALQIGDLGSAALMPGPGPHPAKRTVVRGSVTTPAYSSPEVWAGKNFMPASDVWSVGASFFEVMTMESLFSGESPAKMEEAVLAFDIEHPSKEPERNSAARAYAALRDSNMGQVAAELAELLRQDPLRRPMAATLAKRPATMHRLRTVLARCCLQGEEAEKQAHFASFERAVSESEAAFDLPAPEPEEPDDPKSRRAKRRQDRATSVGDRTKNLNPSLANGTFSASRSSIGSTDNF